MSCESKTIEINGKIKSYTPFPISYVYCLICPIENTPFYVGKTSNPDLRVRLQTHCALSNPNKKLAEKIASLKSMGMYPQIKLILSSDYYQHEGIIIREYAKKYNLLNRDGVMKRKKH